MAFSQRVRVLVLFLGCLSFFGFVLSSDEGATLLEMKKSFRDVDNVLYDWTDSPSSDYCVWRGVTCDNVTFNVIALNLSGLNLDGEISPAIGDLKSLLSIDMRGNHLSGQIPDEIGDCSSLKSLAEYDPKNDLLDQEFMLKGKWFQRKDVEVTNSRGDVLQCSHYMPIVRPEGKALPCVIYCHGNSGCRADASEAAIILLPSNVTVFTLDFSGSGLSGGEHVTLGWNEKDDLRAVVDYLRADGNVSLIGLWGRSMGAVTRVAKMPRRCPQFEFRRRLMVFGRRALLPYILDVLLSQPIA